MFGDDDAFLIDLPDPPAQDGVLPRLLSAGLSLSAEVAAYLSGRYAQLVSEPIADLRDTRHGSPDAARAVIGLHRRMLASEPYVESRLRDPSSGTLDHLHAEQTASLAVQLAAGQRFAGDVLLLLRIAAHLHDADRSFPDLMTRGELATRSDPTAYRRFKERHMSNAAARARDVVRLARRAGARLSAELERHIAYIVGRHELWLGSSGDPRPCVFGGDLDLLGDLLCEADAVSFLETNILTHWAETNRDEQQFVGKLRFSVARLSLPARQLVREMTVQNPSHPLGPAAAESRDDDLRAIRRMLLAALEGATGSAN